MIKLSTACVRIGAFATSKIDAIRQVGNLPMYIVAILAGTLVTAAMLYVLKRPLSTLETPTTAAASGTAD